MAEYSGSSDDDDDDIHRQDAHGVAPPPARKPRYTPLPAINHRRKRRRMEEGDTLHALDSEEANALRLAEDMAGCNLCRAITIMREPNPQLQQLLRLGSAGWEEDRQEYLCVSERERFAFIAQYWNDSLLPELQQMTRFPSQSNFRQSSPTMDADMLVQWTARDVSRHFNKCTRLRDVKIIDSMVADFRDMYEAILDHELFYCEEEEEDDEEGGGGDNKVKHNEKNMATLLKISSHITQMCTTRHRILKQKK